MKGDPCSYCGCIKPAIGYEEVSRCACLNVCEDHASKILLAMKPGEVVGDHNAASMKHKPYRSRY